MQGKTHVPTRLVRFEAAVHRAFHEEGTPTYQALQGTIWGLILVSVGMVVAEAVFPMGPRVRYVLQWVDWVLLIVFVFEYAARVGSYRPPALSVFERGLVSAVRTHTVARLRYALTPMLLIDLLALMALVPELRSLRGLRLLRLLRTVKLFRYNNPITSILRTLEENSLLFMVAFAFLSLETVVGGVSIFLVENQHNEDISTIGDGVWWALVTLTTVGYGDITPQTGLGRIIGVGLMIGGMFTLALFAGFVGTSLVQAMLGIRQEQFRMGTYVNHVVVCGYDPSTDALLEMVFEEFEAGEIRVVVFDDHERPRDLPENALWVQGDPTKQSELDKVRLTHAKAVIVAGARNMTPQVADARTILTVFTIRAYLRSHEEMVSGRKCPLYVVAEILDSENVDHARTAGADEVIETRRVGFSMIAHTVRHHGTADTMSRVLMSGSYNAYVGHIPPDVEAPLSYHNLLVQTRLASQGGLVIGLRHPGQEELFNPPRDSVVQPETLIVYLAERPILPAPE